MAQSWVTMLLLAFGIAVAVVGVIAFLRLNSKDRLASDSSSASDTAPSPCRSREEMEGAEETTTIYEQRSSSD